MLIFQRMQILCAALLLGVNFILVGYGTVRQDPADDENLVVVYNCGTEDWTAPIAKEFQEETGIQVRLVSDSSDALMTRVRTEQENPRGDVLWGGMEDTYIFLASYLERYEYPEKDALRGNFSCEGAAFCSMTMDPYVIAYNTDLVDAEHAPAGWSDLLNPQFRGHIALADPTKSISSYDVLITMMDVLGGDSAVISRMADQLDGRVTSTSAEQIKALADGAYMVTATPEQAVLKYRAAGAHIQIVYPQEGTRVSSTGIAVIKNAPHMENAKKFLNFVMSRQVHERLGVYERRSARADVSAPPNLLPLAEIRCTRFDARRAVAFRDEFLSKWRAAVIK